MAEPNLDKLFREHGFPAVRVGAVTEARFPTPPPPKECGATRVVLAGSQLMSLVNHPSVVPVERVWRKLPLTGAFTANAAAPFSFELGAVQVPAQMVMILLDYRFGIYVPSGIAPGNSMELNDRELSTSVGYDVRFTEKRPDNIRYELTPTAPTETNPLTFSPQDNAGTIPGELSPVSEATFATLRAANSRASVSSAMATLPQRHRRDSQLAMPFTYIIASNQRLNLRVNVFSGIPIPISFWEGEVSGIFMPLLEMHSFLKEIAPCMQ